MGNALFVDTSSWNNPNLMDMARYKAWSLQGDGISRILIRDDQGVGVPDSAFEQVWSMAVGVGIDQIYCYHYAYPNLHPGAAGAVAEAQSMEQVIGSRLRARDKVMLDLEQNESSAWAIAFGQQMQLWHPTASKPVLYDSDSHIRAYLQDPALPTIYDLGLANWTFDPNSRPPCPPPWARYAWLQFTDRLSVPGMPGVVDANVFLAGPPIGLGGGKVLIPHPTQNNRLDLLYTGTDGHIWHNWSGGGIAGLAANAAQFSEAWGAPAGKTLVPLSASGCWDNGGQQLSITVVASDGSIWGKALDAQGGLVQDWVQIAGQAEEVPTAGTPDDDSALDGRVTAIEHTLAGVKAAL